MRWTSLGHAGWLVEASGLRLLFDPILGDDLHGGVHVAHPPRTIDPTGLKPDVVLVSHVHPDHFDVPSLATLARLFPDAPVLTPDPLVVESAEALGFRVARLLEPSKVLTLGGVTLMTTPSDAPVKEWGMVVADDSGCVWNQVDSVIDASMVGEVRRAVASTLDGAGIDVGLVHACPLRELAAVTAGDLGFPYRGWADKLEAWAALQARAVVPAATGFRHAAPFAWRDAHVFPTTADAVRRDLAVAAPDVRTLSCPPGSTLIVTPEAIEVQPGCSYVTPLPEPPLPPWMPLHIPEVVDPALGGETAAQIRAEIDPWLRGELAPAVATHAPRLGVARPLTLVLDVVLPDATHDVHIFVAEEGGCTHRRSRRVDVGHDAVVVVAGSMLADVVAGRRHWGEPLLAGLLRSARRVASLPVFFPYWVLPYRRSVERWVRSLVADHTRRHHRIEGDGV
ncbi:MAG: MBL fold metallo-hydrolase [Myxococcales bacterium]|nr:MBL fold metallo-hydrolase [Myxococcales bacterium]